MGIRNSIAAIGLVLGLAHGAFGQTRVAINLITSNQVTINRPAAAIWPMIVDPSGWKQGLKLVHRSGPVGGQGEVLAAVNPGDTTTAFVVENAHVVAPRQRTIKLVSPTGQLIGFATWTLRESNGKTVVAYDVVSETVVTADQAKTMTPAAVLEQERQGAEVNGRRFQAELETLKRLVEGSR